MRSLTDRVFFGRASALSYICSVFISMLALSAGARAQQSEIRVAVLRSTIGEPGELTEKVDAALLRKLSELAGIKEPTVSPIDYAEIRLTVGCQDQSKDCLVAIAKLLQVDAVLVRVLDSSVAGTTTLSLLYFDVASSDEPTRAETVGRGPDASQAVVDGVASAVRSLFGIPEAVTAAPQQQQEETKPPTPPAASGQPAGDQAVGPAHAQGRIGVFTWISLVAGGVSLATGLVVGLSASDAYDDYNQTTITNESDIELAEVKLDKARSRGTLANVLFSTGGVLLALGGVLLAIDMSKGVARERPSVQAAKLTFQPVRQGGQVILDGRWNSPW